MPRPKPTTPTTPSNNETQKPKTAAAASKTHDKRSVGKTTTAPATAAVGPVGSQEVSVSGKTVPSSIRAGSSHIPSSSSSSSSGTQNQARSAHTATGPVRVRDSGKYSWLLPTTLLRIPDIVSTWPTSSEETESWSEYQKKKEQEQKELRTDTVYKNQGPVSRQLAAAGDGVQSCDTSSSYLDEETLALISTTSTLMATLQALEKNPEATYPMTAFCQAILKYLDGAKSCEEADALTKALVDAFRVANEEKEEDSGKK